MNMWFRRVIFGFVLWVVIRLSSALLFSFDDSLTYELLLDIGFSMLIVVYLFVSHIYFRGLRRVSRGEGWVTGFAWFVTLTVLDLLYVLVLFGQFGGFSLLSYLPSVLVPGLVGLLFLSRR